MALQGSRILLIEDAPDIREVFTVLLRVEGAEVVPVATGREAAEAASARDFDIVLSDLGLPDIPGAVPGIAGPDGLHRPARLRRAPRAARTAASRPGRGDARPRDHRDRRPCL